MAPESLACRRGVALTSSTETRLDHQAVLDAAQRIASQITRTPVLRSDALNQLSGAELHFKCENLQTGGAFKLRGASNAVLQLSEAQRARGVCTHSSGNHGAALARIARQLGIACTVVVPEGASARKLQNMRSLGAQLQSCAATQLAREQGVADLISRSGAVEIPPYDDARIIAGQGTAALEFLDQVADLQAMIVPVGGGGLLAGSLLAADGQCPVFGAEPAGADDTARSIAGQSRVLEHQPETICDGLRALVGIRNLQIISAGVAAVLTVDDEQTRAAMRLIWDELKLVVEPSAAVTLAAVLAYPASFAGRRVGLILSGGNVDLDTLTWQ